MYIRLSCFRPHNPLMCVVLLAVVSFSPRQAYAQLTRLYVNANLTTGANDGTSWANAYQGALGLQSALGFSSSNRSITEIWVAQGLYNPAHTGGPRDVYFAIPGGVAVLGGFAGNEEQEWQRNYAGHPCILSGDLNNDDGPNFTNMSENSYHVVYCGDITGSVVLDGFNIVGGNSNGVLGAPGWPDRGGGVSLDYYTSLVLRNCIIRANRADNYGGGLSVMESSSAYVENCLFVSNEVSRGIVTRDGGAISVRGVLDPYPEGAATIVNCTIVNNSAGRFGGGICVSTGNSTFVYNTIVNGNSQPTGGQVQGVSGGSINNNYNPVVTFSCIQGGYVGQGNINSNPQFVAPSLGDFRLQSGSPCVDRGNSSAVQTEIIRDLAYGLRLIDFPFAPNLGVGYPPVDMGAYEAQWIAEDVVWTSPANGAFDDRKNWSEDIPPGSGENAIFDGIGSSAFEYAVAFFQPATSFNLVVESQRIIEMLFYGQSTGFDGNYNVGNMIVIGALANVPDVRLDLVQIGSTTARGLTGRSASVADAAFSSGLLNVGRDVPNGGTNTIFNLTGDLYVGRRGNGTLNLYNGGKSSVIGSALVSIGTETDAHGILNLTGATTNFTYAGTGTSARASIRIGDNGSGKLWLNSAATVSGTTFTDRVTIGLNVGSTGEVRIIGSDTQWSSANDRFIVGENGSASLDLLNGGRLVTSTVSGVSLGASTTTINGNGSHWSASGGYFRVGELGGASVNVLGGGNLATTSMPVTIGHNAAGTVTLMGAVWNATGPAFRIGESGVGTLRIRSGAQLLSNTSGAGTIVIGSGTSGSALVEIDGANSIWRDESITQTVAIGSFGNATVSVTNGGTLQSMNVGASFPIAVRSQGTIKGNGSIIGSTSSIGNVIPVTGGDLPKPGVLTITGNYRQKQIGGGGLPVSSGSLQIYAAANSFSRLTVSGTADLGGGLIVSLISADADLGDYEVVNAMAVVNPSKFDVAFLPPLQNKFMKVIYPGGSPFNPEGSGSVIISVEPLSSVLGFNGTPIDIEEGVPNSAAVGDLNGDGFNDLAIVWSDGPNTGGVLIAINDGSGQNFTVTPVPASFDNPTSVAIGKLTNDDFPDLAVTNAGGGLAAGSVSILANVAGTGDFLPFGTPIEVGIDPRSIAAHNFNGSSTAGGQIDLVVANAGSNSVFVLLNNGSGGFPQPAGAIQIPVGPKPVNVTPADLENDRDIDLVVASQIAGTVSTILNNNLNGFLPPTVYPVGGLPSDVVVDFLNSDGNPEIVTVNSGDGTISVLVNTSSGPTSSFAPAVNLPVADSDVGETAFSLVAADLDHPDDPKQENLLDVAVLVTTNAEPLIRILRNDTTSATVALTLLEDKDAQSAPGAVALLSGDMDNDNEQDLVVLSDQPPPDPFGVRGQTSGGSLQLLLNSAGKTTPTCTGDVAPVGGDGQVNVNDLLAVINGWGACPIPPLPCAADIAPPPDGDGVVNVNDLLAVINNWGPCP